MAGSTAAATATDTATEAKGRFVVSLPKDVGEQIDAVGKKIKQQLLQSTGVGFDMSRAQIVQALVRQALDHKADGAESAE